MFILPELLPRERRAAFAWRRANPLGALQLLRSHAELFRLAGVNFLDNLAHAALPSVGVLYMSYRYGWDERVVGATMAGVGVCSIIVQAGIVGPITTRFGERAVLIIGLAFGIAGFAVFGMAPTGFWFWVGIPLLAMWGPASPASLGLMNHHVGASEQGQLQGANASIMGIASLFGPGLFTQIFALAIGSEREWGLPGAPFLFLLAALLVVAATIVARRTTQA